MEGITSTTFGYIIAFLLPGFVVLQALNYISDEIRSLLLQAKGQDTNLAVILYLMIVALVSGLIVSCLRDFLLDRLLCKVGWARIKMEVIERPKLDINKMSDQNSRSLFDSFVENHYRYHQFYGNMFISLLLLLILRYWIAGLPKFDTLSHGVVFIGNILIVLFLLFASRQSLSSYCARMKHFAVIEEERLVTEGRKGNGWPDKAPNENEGKQGGQQGGQKGGGGQGGKKGGGQGGQKGGGQGGQKGGGGQGGQKGGGQGGQR